MKTRMNRLIDSTCFRVRSIKRKGKHESTVWKYTMENIVHGTLKEYEITICVCWCQNKLIYVIALYSVLITLSLFVINPSSPYSRLVGIESCVKVYFGSSCFAFILSPPAQLHIYVIFFFKCRLHSPKLLLLLLLFNCLLFTFFLKRGDSV